MTKTFDAAEVAKHNTPESCWVSLYGDVWDVTEFLPNHPGGSNIILKLAGRDATEEYDPIHPPGTLEENLKPEAKLGKIDPLSIPNPEADVPEKEEAQGPPPMQNILNLDEMEEVATKQISKKCWAYYYSAADDLISKSFNNLVYKQILLRPRVFVDCTRCDTSTTLLGHKVGTPLYVSPAAMARLAHPDGEHGIAQGISQFGAMQIVSNNASMTPEQIVEGSLPGQIFGWQLYVQNDRKKSEDMLVRINKMSDKYKFICLTLDAPVPGKREHDERGNLVGASAPVSSGVKTADEPKRPGGGGVGQQLFWGTAADLTWKTTLAWLAKHTDLPIVLKGLQTHEDAYLAAQYAPQVKAIILSNHGGRALDTAPPAVHTLLEIRKYCPEVFSRIEVWVDGGIKRGTDVVKALCLGAKAVGVGRAALFGLGAGGTEGVERTFEILKAETETCMRLLGVEKISDLGPKNINSRAVERDIYDGHAGLEKLGLWVKANL
ncbi:FMN-dependent dehydrogenase [Leptodontidium sp. 2 PMI_412]|nr:L-lactate ferricytochrome c oxidoreductase [Leptodontidium sp. MPI-SDFR-AT-0119]KAH9218961.1 FMN-dependent dehydrogenase [Leptodontidium sp. 2 PMI_412]